MAEKIQVDYEGLNALAGQIGEQGDRVREIFTKIQTQAGTLTTSWGGAGAKDFQVEVEDLVLPAIQRLYEGLERAGEIVAQIRAHMTDAENEAVQQLPGGITPEDANGNRVQQMEAEATESRLNENGITIHSSGDCRDRNNADCTSVEGIREETVNGFIAFRDAVGVDLVMTGGTEVGHAEGEFSHANGYKVDISTDPTVDRYIEDNFEHIGQRSDGAEQYQDANGNVFAREDNHWDITFY